jgi:glycosyltransferase involved in cell wall biosynthesis
MPEISVIVPVYKVEQFLHRCVESILRQSFYNFELILVDDGSPDNCGAICDAYAAEDNRIHVIHQKNGGLSAARNSGIDYVLENSHSHWLAFVDSDDWIHPDFLKTLYTTAQETLCKISACGFFRTEGEPFPEEQDFSVQCLSADDYYCGQIHGGVTAVAWNKLYHRSLFKKLRYPVGKLHEDEFTTYQAVYQVGKIGVTPAQLYAYYQNPEGIMRSEWNPRRMHVLEAFEQQIAFAQKHGNDRLLHKISEQYVFSVYEHLTKAQVVYRKELRRKLREALKLGRECGSFPKVRGNVWLYSAAYPCKPFWWIFSKIQK